MKVEVIAMKRKHLSMKCLGFEGSMTNIIFLHIQRFGQFVNCVIKKPQKFLKIE